MSIRIIVAGFSAIGKTTLGNKYDVVLDIPINQKQIPMLKGKRRLPKILSEEELNVFFYACENYEYKTIFMLIYGSGLRISEATNLRIEDVDSKEMRLFVRNGKGERERYTVLPKASLEMLRKYYKMQKLANGELDIVVLNLPFKDKKYSNIEIIPLKKSTFCFFASKNYIKKHPAKNFKEFENNTLILPKSPSSKKKIIDDFCNKENIDLIANYEVSSSSIMKRLVLNDIGIGFTNVENLKDIKDKIIIINKIEIEDTKEGIATLKKNMSNKATIELVKEIKRYYKQN